MEIIIKCSDDVRGGTNIYGEPIQEIVRCKECRHWYMNNPPIAEECNMLPNPDDFCSYGQKGDENVETD